MSDTTLPEESELVPARAITGGLGVTYPVNP